MKIGCYFTYADNTSLLVAHLAYNFRTRVELMVLLTPTAMMEIAEEDVLKGIECIDYLTDRLDLMRPNMDINSVWVFIKEEIRQYVISHGAMGSTADIRNTMMEIGNRLGLELNFKFGSSVALIFPYTYSVSVIMAASASASSWQQGMAGVYLQTSSIIPSWYFSRRYFESIERLRALLLQSHERNLSESELQSVCAITTWQSRNFIYHVQLDPSVAQHHALSIQPAVGVRDRHGSQNRTLMLPQSVSINRTPPSGPLCVASKTTVLSNEQEKADSSKEGEALENTGTNHVVTENQDRVFSPKCPDESAAASASSSDPRCHPFVEDSGLIQDDLSDLSVVETLRQQLRHSKLADVVHLEDDVDNLIQDARERCKQVSQDLKDLLDAISTVSDPVVIQPLQVETEEKQKQLEEENSILQLLTQLKDEVRGQLKTQQGASVISRFWSLLGPGFISCQLKKIMDSVCGDQEKLQLLMDCAVDAIPAEMLECLRTELASFEYDHPDNRYCQEILVTVLSRKLSYM